MKAPVRAWMTGRPVLAFYVLAFAVTWLAWLPPAAQSHGVPPFTSPIFANPALFIVGGLGPGVAAVVVMRALHGGRAISGCGPRCGAGVSTSSGGSWRCSRPPPSGWPLPARAAR